MNGYPKQVQKFITGRREKFASLTLKQGRGNTRDNEKAQKVRVCVCVCVCCWKLPIAEDNRGAGKPHPDRVCMALHACRWPETTVTLHARKVRRSGVPGAGQWDQRTPASGHTTGVTGSKSSGAL